MTAAFWTLAILCCGYAAWFGGRDGRCASSMIMAAIGFTAIAQNANTDWTSTNVPVMLIDLMLWAGFVRLMLRSRSWWPIWMAAAQTLTIATHVATRFLTGYDQGAYVGLGTFWSIPCLLSMVVGVTMDLRDPELSRR